MREPEFSHRAVKKMRLFIAILSWERFIMSFPQVDKK